MIWLGFAIKNSYLRKTTWGWSGKEQVWAQGKGETLSGKLFSQLLEGREKREGSVEECWKGTRVQLQQVLSLDAEVDVAKAVHRGQDDVGEDQQKHF